MEKLSEITKLDIEKEVADVESKSSCELVAVLTQKSSDYTIVALLAASLIAIMLPAFLLIWKSNMNALTIYEAQVVTFVIAYLVLSIDKIQQIFMPQKILHKKASIKAYENFFMLGLHKTTNHQAIMIFVSLHEHFVKIIVDTGISNKLQNNIWQKIIDEFTLDVKNGDFEKGYIKAIRAIGEILKIEFPVQKNDKNELSNSLVEI
ncbi:MAG: TPM domain-containing protein [Sulfurovaceae bacterium]|nr:TPM domain-containing protein [Sulfurovaceae bacterium]